MKKIVLSTVAGLTLATSVLASGDTNTNTSESNGFFDRFHAKGDLRLRQEVVEKDGEIDKNRERYRFRYSVDVDIVDNILLETAISSGKYNPTSGNVTFNNDDESSHDEIQNYFIDKLKIDVADIKYSFGNSWIRVGKSKHNIYRAVKTQIVWDNDIRLEGVNYGYKDGSHMVRLGANRLHREKGNKGTYADDINMFIAQYVNTQKLDNAKLNLGAAYYLYDGVKGSAVPYDSGFKGNTDTLKNGVEVYKEDYGIAEVFAEVKFDVMDMPFKAAATGVYNTLASDDNFGYDISAELKMTKKWKAAVTYRDVEEDAVFGAHNDSDMAGGGTDHKGYYIKTKYKFADNVDIGAWFNWSDTKLSSATPVDYYRHQLDVILKF